MLISTRSVSHLRLCLATLLTLLPLQAAHAAAYSFQDVGNDGKYYNSKAMSISDTGYVAGSCDDYTVSDITGFIWQNETLTDLPVIPGTVEDGVSPQLYPHGVNDSGAVTGNETDLEGDSYGFVSQNGATSEMVQTSTGYAAVIGYGINTAGQVTGSDYGSGVPFIYLNGTETDLPCLTTVYPEGTVTCINNSSPYEVAGDSSNGTDDHATLWKNGAIYDLGTLDNGANSYATGINDGGQVVGYSDINQLDANGEQIYHAFLWTPTTPNGTSGTMHDLGVLTSGDDSSATGINNSGTVVGSSVGAQSYAFVWTSSGGMVNLNTVVGPIAIIGIGTPTSSNLAVANAINNSGQIAADIDFSPSQYPNVAGYSYHGCVLTPTGAVTAALSSLSFSPALVTAGTNSIGTVTLTSAAPSGGAVVNVTMNGNALGTVTVPAGSTSVSYTQETADLVAGTNTGSASYIGKQVTGSLTVNSNPNLPVPTSLSYSPNTVAPGQTVTCTLTFSAATPSAGCTAYLFDNGNEGRLNVAGDATVVTYTLTAGSVPGTYFDQVIYNGGNAGTEWTISSSATPAALSSVAFSPASVTGGLTSKGTVTLASAAPTGGEKVTLKSSSSAVTVPSSVTVAAGATTGTFTATTSSVSSSTTVTITATQGSTNKTATLKLTSPSLVGVSLSPNSVTGGSTNATGNVTLNVAAPSAGTSITLSSSNTAALTVPSSVTVPSGKSSVTFTATSYAVTSATSVTVTATRGSTSYTATETVNPVGSSTPVALSSLAFNPSSVTGGLTSTGTVTLVSAAPTGGEKVTLSSGASTATVPSSVTVAAGATTATFTATTSAVSSSTSVTITATAAGASKTATLKLTSPGLSGLSLNPTSVTGGAGNATGTVTINAAAPSSGVSVTLSSSNTSALTVPSSVTVPSGKTSVTFTATSYAVASAMSVTVTATRGSTSKTVTETVNPASASATLASYSFSPSSVTGGNGSTATVTLTAAAPANGASVAVTYNGSAWYTLTIAAGQTSGTYPQPTSATSSAYTDTFTATYNGTMKSATLTITP